MKFIIKFYARLRDEIIERMVESPDFETALFAVKPYGSSVNDIIQIVTDDKDRSMNNEGLRLEAEKRAAKCIEYACGRTVGEPDYITNQFMEFAELLFSCQWKTFDIERPEEPKWYFVRFESQGKYLFEKAFYDLTHGWLCPNSYEDAVVLNWMEIPEIPEAKD